MSLIERLAVRQSRLYPGLNRIRRIRGVIEAARVRFINDDNVLKIHFLL